MEPKRKRGPRIPKLTSVARCGAEIGKLYRLMRNEKLSTADGKRMCDCLLALKACLESATLEQRVANLEAQADTGGTVEHFGQGLFRNGQHRKKN
jgi:hypothetical protein